MLLTFLVAAVMLADFKVDCSGKAFKDAAEVVGVTTEGDVEVTPEGDVEVTTEVDVEVTTEGDVKAAAKAIAAKKIFDVINKLKEGMGITRKDIAMFRLQKRIKHKKVLEKLIENNLVEVTKIKGLKHYHFIDENLTEKIVEKMEKRLKNLKAAAQ